MARTDLDIASEDGGQQLVQASSDIPLQPALATSLAFLHGDFEHDGDLAVSLGKLGPLNRPAFALVTSFAPHQRLLR